MATEKLIVELDAKTSKLDSKLNQTDKKLKDIGNTTEKADSKLANFGATAAKGALAVTALAAAVGTAINSARQFAIELEVASNRAGVSVEKMQSLAFATSTVGISLEKLGDISKDTSEKVGEYLTTGGGGFQDFADVMNLTKMEARALAEEFSTLSGPEVLQRMVNEMEGAGVGANKMSFALEGMASDTTDLIPLLSDSGEKLKTLEDNFNGLNNALTDTDLEKIKAVGEELDLMGSYFGNEAKKLVADYSEELINAIQMIVTLADKTTGTFNVITSGLSGLFDVAQAGFSDSVNDTDTLPEVLAEASEKNKEALNELFGFDYYNIGKSGAEKYGEGFEDGSKPLYIKIKKGQKQLTEWEELSQRKRYDIQEKFLKAGSILANTFFEDNKAIQAGIIVAETAVGVMKALSTSSNIYEGFANAAIVVATGIAQLNNVMSASKGGGAMSAGSGGASGAGGIAQPQQGDQEELSTLSINDNETDASGATSNNQIVVRFATDSGDALIDALAGSLNDRQRRGV